MRSSKTRVWLILTIVAGLTTALLVGRYLSRVQQTAAPQAMATVVVAAKNIPQGTRLTAEMLNTVKMPAEYVHKQAFNDPAKVVRLFARVDLVADQVLLSGQLESEKTSNELPYRIPEGKRAITIAVTAVTGVAGHIKPGHHIDLLGSYAPPPDSTDKNPKFVTLLQNVPVLAVGPDLQKKEGVQAVEDITLAVSPQEAELLTLAETTGKLRAILRPADDDAIVPLRSVDIKKLQAQYP